MEVNRYKIQNTTRETSVSSGVTVVNSAREPLTALRVMVEGLGSGEETGLWLTQVTVIPMVPRISPFDLVYLDADHRVVERVELLPSSQIPRFKKPASSALVLPFRTISSAQIETGDQFAFEETVEPQIEEVEPVSSESTAQPEPETVAPGANSAELTIVEEPLSMAEFESPFLNPFLNAGELSEQAPADEVPQPAREGKKEEFVLADFLRKEAPPPREAVTRRTEEPALSAVAAPTPNPAAQAIQIPAKPVRKRRTPKAREAPIKQPVQRAIEKPGPAKAMPQGKKPAVDRFLRWLYPALYTQNRRDAERRPSEGLAAYDFNGDEPRIHEVGNISSHGLYLRTQQRWEPGTAVSLTLQPSGPFEVESTLRVEFDCAVVRLGPDGVGMTFALPDGVELKLWEAPGRNGADEADPICLVRELRMARALAFMRRICPPADAQVTELFHKTLSNVRASNIVEVALRAERLLDQEPNADCVVAHPDLILRILEHGSWVDVEWLQDLWAGLLATSCTFEGQDESNREYINLLSKLSPLPTQILTMACAKVMQVMTESAAASPAHLACSAEEIAKITRSNNLLKIYKSIGELSELGLVERNPRSASPENPGDAKAVPTRLGLEMFARCNGQRELTPAA